MAVRNSAEADASSRRNRMSGIDRALQILDHLHETGAPAGPYAIAKAIGAPLSTAYAVIDDLIEKDLLGRRVDGAVWLGPRLHRYGLTYAHSLDFLEIANGEMHTLCRDIGETVQVCGRDGDSMVVLAMAEGPGHFRVTSRVGTRVPLNWTASGRLLVGHLPPAERLALFQRCGKASPTGRAETDAGTLAAAAGKALAARLSIQIGESDFSVACVAAPICDADGACKATISIVLPEQKIARGRARFASAVQSAAGRIEAALGWRKHGLSP
jgi:DNA-binding IclR family transcriptional regulator